MQLKDLIKYAFIAIFLFVLFIGWRITTQQISLFGARTHVLSVAHGNGQEVMEDEARKRAFLDKLQAAAAEYKLEINEDSVHIQSTIEESPSQVVQHSVFSCEVISHHIPLIPRKREYQTAYSDVLRTKTF